MKILFLCFIIGCCNLMAQVDSYERDRQIEKDAQRLADWDKSQREASKERAEKWDRGEYKDGYNKGVENPAVVFAFFIVAMVLMCVWFFRPLNSKK